MLESKTYIAIEPGATIKEMLNERGMTQKEFAARMDYSEKHVSKLINGETQLTHETAFRLESVLGPSATFWNNLEVRYRENLIKVLHEQDMEQDEQIAKLLPYSEMVKLGWINAATTIQEKVCNLRKYFEVSKLSLLGNGLVTRIVCRRLAITEKTDIALIAWAQRAKIIAKDISPAPLNIDGLTNQLSTIRKLSMLPFEQIHSRLYELLLQYGIALVFVPHLKGSFLQGAVFFDGDKIILGITTRRKTNDIFWFTLFHELAHIILGHTGRPNEISDKEEKIANTWAEESLIPPSKYTSFINKGVFTKEQIVLFAKHINIAQGIVVGRLQNDKFLNYNMYNDLKDICAIQ